MPNEFDDLDELFDFLDESMDKALKKEVGNKVRKVMKDKIKTVVYQDEIKPKQYDRKYSHGGLIDDKNIAITDEGQLKVGIEEIRTNDASDDRKAPAGTKNVAEIVEYGEGYTWVKSEIYKNQPHPRPFTQATIDELEKNEAHVDALKDGLNRQGIRVTKEG